MVVFLIDCTWHSMWNVYTCPWVGSRTVAYIDPRVPNLMDGCDYARHPSCTGKIKLV